MDFPKNNEFEDLETTKNIDYNESFINPITEEGETESDEGDENESNEEGITTNIIDSPGGSHHLYQSIVPKEFLSDTSATYNSLNEAIEMYRQYADNVGFDVRELSCMFWADETNKAYYIDFGDIISFDATFQSNKKKLHEGAWNCSIYSMETVDGLQCLSISYVDSTSQAVTRCKVELKMPDIDITCTCQYYIREGILCRHIFRVLINHRIEEIPEKYILRTWKKYVISSHLLVAKHGCVETQDETFKIISEAYSNIDTCVDLVKDNKEELKSFVETPKFILKEMEKKMYKKQCEAQ
ncbi:hypothetical protein LXL04_034850 [Taraxacum kok-saghyz]